MEGSIHLSLQNEYGQFLEAKPTDEDPPEDLPRGEGSEEDESDGGESADAVRLP